MAHDDRLAGLVLTAQRRIARLAERDHELTIRRVSIESGIPYGTARSYFSQAKDIRLHEMPVSAVLKLVGVIPDDLLSHLFEPVGKKLVDDPTAKRSEEGDEA